MNGKALIVGIEKYNRSHELSRQLEGSGAAARAFFDWVTRRKNISPKSVWACLQGKFPPGVIHKFGTERRDLKDALYDLILEGQDETEELFVFFSGHGFCFEESFHAEATDILVTSDFVDRGRSGDCCLQLGEIRTKLNLFLGGKHHYHFIDACRTVIKEKDLSPGSLGISFPHRAMQGNPSNYLLFSTQVGAAAFTDSGFADRLLEGLGGTGRSKDYGRDGRLFVKFPLVAKYVRDRLKDQRPAQEMSGDGEGLILEIKPIPTYHGQIRIVGGKAGDKFRLIKRTRTSPRYTEEESFQGALHQFEYQPSDISIEVQHAGRALLLTKPKSLEELDFFEDGVQAVFTKRVRPSQPGGRIKLPDLGSLKVRGPAGTTFRMLRLNAKDRSEMELPANKRLKIPSGTYEISLKDPHRSVARQIIDVHPGSGTLDPLAPPGKTRRKIIETIGFGDPVHGSVNFSEQLDEMRDRDLTLWLTILGASRLIRHPDLFSKIGDLPLAKFDDMALGESRLFLLTGFEKARKLNARFELASRFRQDPFSNWTALELVDQLGGVRQWVQTAVEGTYLLSLREGDDSVRTWVTHCLPNRVTLAVFAEDGKGRPTFHQFLLPAHHLVRHLPKQVQGRLAIEQAPLRLIRTMHLVQNQFAHGRTLAPAEEKHQNLLADLLHGKWIDPIMSMLASYEILRRGTPAERQLLKNVVVRNLREFFGSLPDIPALAKSLQLSATRPNAPPLITEGLVAFPDWEDSLPLPANRLIYESVWTCWRGAV